MKTFMIALALTLMSVSLATAAGNPSIKSTTSEDIKIYNNGVELMMDKKFSKAEKQFRKTLALNENFTSPITIWHTRYESKVQITMTKL